MPFSLLNFRPMELPVKLFLYSLGVKEYYERQFATMRSFEEVDSICMLDVVDDHENLEKAELAQNEFAMQISNYANIVLLALKVMVPEVD